MFVQVKDKTKQNVKQKTHKDLFTSDTALYNNRMCVPSSLLWIFSRTCPDIHNTQSVCNDDDDDGAGGGGGDDDDDDDDDDVQIVYNA